MSYTVTLRDMAQPPTIIVVGTGGTGSLVSDGLCRLLIGRDERLLLVDPDRVEPHNLRRQAFYAGDVGNFKAQVLAERLSRQYGRRIGYSVMPYEKDLLDKPMGNGMIQKALSLIIIGCTDNVAARRSIAESISWDKWWVDSGNSNHSGQVLIGNVKERERLREAFDSTNHTVRNLPMPSLQLPALLIPPTKTKRPRDCAEAVEDDEQSPTINQAMATLVLDYVYRLLRGTLTTMGSYIDLDAGTLQTVPATPVTVARMLGMKVKELMANKCSLGARYHI